MLKFNNDNIFTGYIKQLLSTFELPNIRVVKDNIILIPGQLYIYNNDIIQIKPDIAPIKSQSLTDSDYIVISSYIYGGKSKPAPASKVEGSLTQTQKTYIPYTKTLQNNTLVYDSYTHKYLGNYLRFMRDYKHLNLMSLYNCFSNEIADNIKVDFSVTIEGKSYSIIDNLLILSMGLYTDPNTMRIYDNLSELDADTTHILYLGATTTTIHRIFNSSDKGYVIYMVPVKFFEKYTIAMDCSSPVETICGFYHKGTIVEQDMLSWSYKRYCGMRFTSPQTYDMLNYYLNDDVDLMSQKQNLIRENNLKLFIKVPASCKSSIVVLEGDYTNSNDFILNQNHTTQWNRSAINIEALADAIEDGVPNLTSSLQLLNYNSGISYPFADRLIEYLIQNTVDLRDKTSDNVKRVQQTLLNKINKDTHYLTIKDYGVWEEKYRYLLYGLAFKNNNIAKDTLGYYDKDLEHILGDVDIYPDISETKTKNKQNR